MINGTENGNGNSNELENLEDRFLESQVMQLWIEQEHVSRGIDADRLQTMARIADFVFMRFLSQVKKGNAQIHFDDGLVTNGFSYEGSKEMK
jgi:hypothetical protein